MSEFKIYNTDQVSKLLGVSRMTVIRYIRKGKLKSFRVGRLIRVTSDMIDEYIANNPRK